MQEANYLLLSSLHTLTRLLNSVLSSSFFSCMYTVSLCSYVCGCMHASIHVGPQSWCQKSSSVTLPSHSLRQGLSLEPGAHWSRRSGSPGCSWKPSPQPPAPLFLQPEVPHPVLSTVDALLAFPRPCASLGVAGFLCGLFCTTKLDVRRECATLRC